MVAQGRVLHATFTLKPGKRTYVTLFALDVVGNFSKVSKLMVAAGTAVVPKSKKKKPAGNKTVKKPAVKKPAVKKPAVEEARHAREGDTRRGVRGGAERPTRLGRSAESGVVDDPDDLAVARCDERARQRLTRTDACEGIALALAEREDQHEARALRAPAASA